MDSASAFGQGLIEISAIATLIGGPVAESLVHGQKGAGGLAWAPMSSFGSIHVVKACMSAALPDSVRESVGMRENAVDDAIGLQFSVAAGKRAKGSAELGDAVAVAVDRSRLARRGWLEVRKWRRERRKNNTMSLATTAAAIVTATTATSTTPMAMATPQWKRTMTALTDATLAEDERKTGVEDSNVRADAVRDIEEGQTETLEQGQAWCESPDAADVGDVSSVYIMDRKTRLTLSTVPGSEDGEEVLIYIFHPDIDAESTTVWDWGAIALSLVKLAEVLWLWQWGSEFLWIVTMIPWLHAALSAVFFQVAGLSRDDGRLRTVDLAAGNLPTPQRLHKGGKLVIGLPPNVCRRPARRAVVGLGALVNVAILVVSFVLLGREDARVAYLWMGFQGLWLICRTVVYHFLPSERGTRQAIMESVSWADADAATRRRTLGVLTAISRHQAAIHPRGPFLYATDCQSLQQLAAIAARSVDRRNMALGLDPAWIADCKTLDVVAAAGDIFMRSVAWFRGSRAASNLDLYDACLFFLRTGGGGDVGDSKVAEPTLHAVAGVRCCACDCPIADSRTGRASRQRGTTCHMYCKTMAWRLFVPFRAADGVERWVYVSTPALVGRCRFEILGTSELHHMLATHRWRISLTHIDQLRKAYRASQEACDLILGFLLEGQGRPAKLARDKST